MPVLETQFEFETQCFISKTGARFHRVSRCGNMNPNTARVSTVGAAEGLGLVRCGNCWR